MNFFPDGKTLLEISVGSFNLKIAWYAVLILCGALLAYFLSLKNAKKIGYGSELLEDYFITMLPLSILGARIWYVMFEWYRFSANPISAFYIWEGGLAIQGGLIVGVLYSYFFFSHKGVNFLRIGDCIMPNVLLAQMIGRWGNFFNQEAYGNVVSGDYFNGFPKFIKDQMYINSQYRQPMFLYEGIGNLIGWILITFVYKKYGRKKRGDLIYAYACWYGFIRFFVEALRSDSLMFMGLKVAQVISILFIILGGLGIIGVYDKLFKNKWPFKHEKPTILFDFDGTLANSFPLIKESFKHTFKQHPLDYEISDDEIQSFFGPPLRDSFLKHYSQAEMDEVLKTYRAHNRANQDKITPMPHAKELLDYLKANDYEIAIVSSKMHEVVELGLKATNLNDYFEVIIGCDDCDEHKPSPKPLLSACKELKVSHDDVIYVGDTIGDIESAKNMGAYSICYLSNDNKEDIRKAKPCRIITDLNEIKEIIKEDREWSEFVI